MQWVHKQLESARELWGAMSKHNRSTLDDFSLVPTTDADWDMLDCSAVEELLQVNPRFSLHPETPRSFF